MNQIKIGTMIEKEHTKDIRIAKKIAMDHLKEIPDYYTRLIKMEKEAKMKAKKRIVRKTLAKRSAKLSGHKGSKAMATAKSNPIRLPPFEKTTINTWFERDRSYVGLEDLKGNTIVEFWDDEVADMIESGYLNPKNLHKSCYEYAKDTLFIKPIKKNLTKKNPSATYKIKLVDAKGKLYTLHHAKNGYAMLIGNKFPHHEVLFVSVEMAKKFVRELIMHTVKLQKGDAIYAHSYVDGKRYLILNYENKDTTIKNPDKANYRIIKKDGRIKNAGTDKPSYFTLQQAMQIVNRKDGETIYEYNGGDRLWEVF